MNYNDPKCKGQETATLFDFHYYLLIIAYSRLVLFQTFLIIQEPKTPGDPYTSQVSRAAHLELVTLERLETDKD